MPVRPAVLPDLLLSSASRAPESPSIEGTIAGAGPEIWSYARLAETSARVASALAGAGVRPGDRVALCHPKSPESVAVLFGILRAGAVFVPLDRTAPASRLAGIVRDCSAKIVAGSGRRLAEVLSLLPAEAVPAAVIEIATAPPATGPAAGARRIPWTEVLDGKPAAPGPARKATDLAYLLYTSGSTGTPKGVMITHENALAFTSWACESFGIAAGDRASSVAPLHFDLSTFDLYSTLEGGGTVVIVPEDVTLFPNALAGFLEASRVTVTYLVPSVVTGMILHGDLASRDLSALRLLLFAGEVFPPRHLAALMGILPARVELHNLYGPTETNVCTSYRVRSGDKGRETPVPIGRPASGDTIFAVDESGALVDAPGREGELHAAGPTVAAGYWGDEERTRRSFLDGHPLAPRGQRVYRTGDVVSIGPEGNWLYHGRRDHMVKSRGYRIELGDIESALLAHPDVAEAAAVAIPDDEIGSRLKACVVPRAGASVSPAQIQHHCGVRLPKYMVPERVEVLPSLPKTSSGKIDRARLAAAP